MSGCLLCFPVTLEFLSFPVQEGPSFKRHEGCVPRTAIPERLGWKSSQVRLAPSLCLLRTFCCVVFLLIVLGSSESREISSSSNHERIACLHCVFKNLLEKCGTLTSKVNQGVEVHVAKPEGLSQNPGTHMTGGETQLLERDLQPPHRY